MFSLPAIATAVVLGASALHGHHARTAEVACQVTTQAPFSIGVDRLGSPSYEINAGLNCNKTRWNDMRLCPQQLIDGTWQFIAGSGGWGSPFVSGTCRDAWWTSSAGTSMMSQFAGTPGQTYRTWVETWVRAGGTKSVIATSAPYMMPTA